MAGFDYDVLMIGSGFGGSVAALRAGIQRNEYLDDVATEKGRGKRSTLPYPEGGTA